MSEHDPHHDDSQASQVRSLESEEDVRPSPDRWPRGWVETTRSAHKVLTQVFSYRDPQPDQVWSIEHDEEKRIYRMTGPEGELDFFRAELVKYLVVVPVDRQGEEVEPDFRHGIHGRPRYLYLCAEEREVR
jgi:hypothetical protein